MPMKTPYMAFELLDRSLYPGMKQRLPNGMSVSRVADAERIVLMILVGVEETDPC